MLVLRIEHDDIITIGHAKIIVQFERAFRASVGVEAPRSVEVRHLKAKHRNPSEQPPKIDKPRRRTRPELYAEIDRLQAIVDELQEAAR